MGEHAEGAVFAKTRAAQCALGVKTACIAGAQDTCLTLSLGHPEGRQ